MPDDPPLVPLEWRKEKAMTCTQVAEIFGVSMRTVVRWSMEGMIGFFRTPTGWRRFPECEVDRLLLGLPPKDPQLLIDLATYDHKKYREMWEQGWHRGAVGTTYVGNVRGKGRKRKDDEE